MQRFAASLDLICSLTALSALFISQHITLDRASSLAAPFTSTSDRWFWAKMVTVVTVTEVTVFSGGGIRVSEYFQIVSNNNR